MATNDLDSEKEIVITPVLANYTMVPLGLANGKVLETLEHLKLIDGRDTAKLEDIKRHISRVKSAKPASLTFWYYLMAFIVVVLIVYVSVNLRKRRVRWEAPLARSESHLSVPSRAYKDLSPLRGSLADGTEDRELHPLNPIGTSVICDSFERISVRANESE